MDIDIPEGQATAQQMPDEHATVEQEHFSGSLTERLVHKNFKARKQAYEELQQMYSVGPPPEDDYSSFFKKMINDSNVIAQEVALDFFLVYFDKVEGAAKDSPVVISGAIDKCLGANKSSLAKKAQDLLQLIIEIDTPEPVVLELLKAFKQKAPKLRLAAVQCVAEAVRNFGKRVPFKELTKKDGILVVFNDQDGKVRKEAQTLAVEMYKFVKDNLKGAPFFNELRDGQKAELEKLFAEVQSEPPPKCARGLRSDAQSAGSAAPDGKSRPGDDGSKGDSDDFIEAQPVLSKLPPKFFEVVLGNGKWQERKETLEVLANLTNGKRLQADDYLEVVKMLKRLLNDSNIPIVALSVKILGFFATGLKSGFSSYTRFYFSTLLDKYKEKKVTILEPLNTTMELLHIHGCVALPDFAEDIIAAVTSKVPQVRENALLWLERCLNRSDKPAFQKAFKPLSATIAKACDDSCGPVRDAALKILAAAQLTLGEQSVAAYIPKLDKKLQEKFRTFLKDAPIDSGMSATSSTSQDAGSRSAPRDTPRTARRGESTTLKRIHESPSQSSDDGAPPLKRSVSSVSAKPRKLVAPSGASSARDTKGGKAAVKAETEDFSQVGMSDAEVEAAAAEFIPEPLIKALQSSSFKERGEAMDKLTQTVGEMEDNMLDRWAELLIRFLKCRPGWKEANFQVLNKIFQLIITIAKRSKSFSKRCVWLCLPCVIDKISDFKQKTLCRECLTLFCEAVGPRFVFDQLMKAMADCKAPKTICEVLDWMAEAIEDFGCSMFDVKAMIAMVKEAFEKQNPSIKTAGIKTLVALRKTYGPRLRDMLNDVKPQLLVTIDEHFARVEDVQGGFQPKKSARVEEVACHSTSAVPRSDISGQITSALLSEMSHADWKKRQTALSQAEKIVESANRRITPSVGPLISACKARLGDSNKNLTVQALNLLGLLAQSMGPATKTHLKGMADGIFHCLSETKPNVRQAALSALTAIENETGFEPLLPFLPKAFDLQAARQDLTQWIATTLNAKGAGLPPGCLISVIKPVINCLQDRNGEVRKNAEAILGPLLRNVGYDAVSKETRDLKPAMAKTINAFLDKQRGSVLFTPREPARLVDEDKENDGSRVNLVAAAQDIKIIGDVDKVPLKPRMENICIDPVSERMSPITADIPRPERLYAEAQPAATPWMGHVSPIPAMPDAMEICTGPVAAALPDWAATAPPASIFTAPPVVDESTPMDIELPACRVDLQLDATFAPSVMRRSTSLAQQNAPVRVSIPMTDRKAAEAVSRTEHCQAKEKPNTPEQLLERVLSGNNAQCIDALKVLIDNFISTGDASCYDTNQVLECLLHRSAQVFETDPLHVREAKFLLNALQGVYAHPGPAEQASRDIILYTITVSLGQLQGDKLRQTQGGDYLLKAFNTVILKMLENSNRPLVFSCLLERLHEAYNTWKGFRSDENQRLVELLVKCVLKSVSFIATSKEVDMRTLLRAVDTFLIKNPPSAFKPPEDMPLRTVKTALSEFVKLLGPAILKATSPDFHPLTIKFIQNCLEKLGYPSAPFPMAPPPPLLPRTVPSPQGCPSLRPMGDAVDPTSSSSPEGVPLKCSISASSSSSSVGTLGALETAEADQSPLATQLDDLFVRIRNKEHTIEGIHELHRVITENPSLDIEPWLGKTSYPFQCYIKRQLQSIQAKIGSQAATPAPQCTTAQTPMTLEALRARVQQQVHSHSDFSSASNLTSSTTASPVDVGAQFESIRQRMRGMFQSGAQSTAGGSSS